MYLSADQDTASILKLAGDALDMGADPTLLTYTSNDSGTPFYTCYEFALFLSLYPGEQLTALLSRLKARGATDHVRAMGPGGATTCHVQGCGHQ